MGGAAREHVRSLSTHHPRREDQRGLVLCPHRMMGGIAVAGDLVSELICAHGGDAFDRVDRAWAIIPGPCQERPRMR